MKRILILGSTASSATVCGRIGRPRWIYAHLVAGGAQTRTFTSVDDGVDALLHIIENPGGVALHRLFDTHRMRVADARGPE